MPSYQEILAQVAKNQAMPLAQREQAQMGRLTGEADVYRKALEKAEYGQLGRDLSSGYGQIERQLAGMGPLADSGAGNALRAKLASTLYGAAQGRTSQGYADYLKQIMQSQRQFRQNQILQKQAQKAQKGSFLQDLAGIAGGFIPGLGALGGGGGGYGGQATGNWGGGSFVG
jgi:uncharacterized protein (DUF697 family)